MSQITPQVWGQSLPLKYIAVDVFTHTKYTGNPLAVVLVTPEARQDPRLTQEARQRIAREFNYSETVFLYLPDVASVHEGAVRYDIFTTDEELPFAGHPTIGTAWVARQALGLSSIKTLLAKAGAIGLEFSAGQHNDGSGSGSGNDRVRAEIPHNVHIHSNTLGSLMANPNHKTAIEPGLSTRPRIRAAELSAPPVSIVQGMTFLVIELASLEDLALVSAGPTLACDLGALPDLLDEGPWKESFVGRYYYVRTGGSSDAASSSSSSSSSSVGSWKGQARMVERGLEDPATGSAACTLASYLALAGKAGSAQSIEFEVTQGLEMGRRSEIELEVKMEEGDGKSGNQSQVKKVFLGGSAVPVMEGTVHV